ncbi:FMN-linked oxidoreductase [Phellopilus nigrolimitatus]|nr:FMN-linked oxidoreductase [Phellopilus nigrolimitatus]
MVSLNRLHISPPLVNSSCAWASDDKQLRELYESEFTGAVTTRTATLNGFTEDPTIHTVAFSAESSSSVNSYGYSPHPLSQYLSWVEKLLRGKSSSKPVIISITSSKPPELVKIVEAIQQLRQRLGDAGSETSRIGIELNTSCPNIDHAPPPSYTPDALSPLLAVLAMSFWSDRTLTIGLKLPPYTYATQFTDVLRVIAGLSRDIGDARFNPIAFLTCTNTLGSSLLFGEQTLGATTSALPAPINGEGGGGTMAAQSPFALPTPLGGLAGEALHALALGNVYTFAQLLSKSGDPALQRIALVGVGGVTCSAAVARMHRAGAQVVGCATLLGREGVRAFEMLSTKAY